MAYKNNKTANRRRYKSRYHSPHNYKAKKPAHQYRAAIIVAVATFVILASLVVVFAFGDRIFTFLDKNIAPATPLEIIPATMEVETIDPADVPTQPPTEKPTEPPTEKPTKAAEQLVGFTSLLKKANTDISSLGTQAIIVESDGTSATVYTYEKDQDGVYQQKFKPLPGYVGEEGVSSSVGPSDAATPAGTYHIEYAFGNNADPGTALTYYPVTAETRWVTDPDSVNYNLLVDDDVYSEDWGESQWLYEYTVSYPYAVVFDYNRHPVKKDQGCAKFLHVSDKPTQGGIGISEDNLREILLWLQPDQGTITIF